jgi:SWI/SNF-related matrix-associated actin-dependent regulator of chromatin subfamily D
VATARLYDILPTASPYFELLEWERQIDQLILNKQMRVADAAFKGPKTRRTLRITVYNLANDQPPLSSTEQQKRQQQQSSMSTGPYAVFCTENNDGDLLAAAAGSGSNNGHSDAGPKLIPSWTLRVEGKLEAKAGRPSPATSKRFSQLIRSIHIQIGDDGNDLVEWRRTASSLDFDGFEVKRRGAKNVKAKILIELENRPERFRLSPSLSALLNNIQNCTKPHIVMAMWRYVKLNKLQESDEKKLINCDKPLSDLFGVERCTFSELPALLNPHLSPLDPIEIVHEVVVDNGATVNANPFVYESEVDIDDSGSRLNRTIISSPNLYNLQLDIDSTTIRLRELSESLRATLHNQRLLKDFAHDPVSFINTHYRQQCDDINAVLGDARVNIGDLFRADRFYLEDVESAVVDMVSGISEMRLHHHH